MKNIKKIFASLLFVLIIPISVLAQSPTNPGTPQSPVRITATISNPLLNANGGLMGLITDILGKIVMPIAAVGVVVWIIWAGFQFVLARGNPSAIGKAQENLLWSLIGAGILLGAYGISQVLQSTINALIAS